MARGRAVAVVALLVLSGCQGFDGGGGETVTPAPVPTAGGEVTGDAEAVADRHRRSLDNRSHTTTVSLSVTYPNGTTARLRDEFAVRSDGSYRYHRRVSGPYPQDVSNVTLWQADATEYRRVDSGPGGTSVRTSDAGGLADRTVSGFLRRALTGFDVTVDQGSDRTRLTGEQTDSLGVPLPDDLRNARNGTLEVEIRDDIVRWVTVRAGADHPSLDRSVSVRVRVTVQRVGATDPTRPAWARE